MNIKLTHKNLWRNLWPFHKKAKLWQRFEPLWFSLIAIAAVSAVAVGLRVAISHQIVGVEKLYISPSSYSVGNTDFFDSENNTDIATESDEIKKEAKEAFDPFIIPVARAQSDADNIDIIVKK